MSVDPTFEAAVAALVSKIEKLLGWGSGLEWSTHDFENLSRQIHERTSIQLSVATLKRVWKKVEYRGKPTITTLDALASFAGSENWQQFRHQWSSDNAMATAETEPTPTIATIPTTNKNRKSGIVWIGLAACTAAVVFYVTAFRPSATNRGKAFSFSSKKVIDSGVPNTVIFDYDASDCEDDDSVSIQQSWDPKLTEHVDPRLRTHTSIYYYPGFFDARLKVNGEVVQKHKLMIKSDGWLSLLETSPMPVYFPRDAAEFNGSLSVPMETIRQTGIALQPEAPWCSYYNVGDKPVIKSDDFVFEASIRNDFGEGAAACRYTEVHILFEGAAMVIPLSKPGCVSNLDFYDKNGKVTDLSPLGVELQDWVNVRFEVADSVAQVLINSKKAFDLITRMEPLPWVGMIFKFRGAGSIDYVRVSRKNGDVVYEESFEETSDARPKPVSLLNSY
ncbi:hypothetical protein WBG78_17765 [Chryseolinea sp. T2]|uniref:hypothetical protein n=1 Tax=Chryseolinea sp. T2 TaxID=3129255 RepID=UPI0030784110